MSHNTTLWTDAAELTYDRQILLETFISNMLWHGAILVWVQCYLAANHVEAGKLLTQSLHLFS